MKMLTVRYVCKERDDYICVSLPKGLEFPSRVVIRNPDEDYREYDYWFDSYM